MLEHKPIVDANGLPMRDPTDNVRELFEAAEHRGDDLRSMSKQVFETHISYLKRLADLHERFDDKIHAKEEQIANMRESFQDRLATKEASRIDANMQLAREVADKTVAAAQTAIDTVARNTTNLADTLRNQVQETAAAAEARRSADNAEIVKRLSALERSSSEGQGKESISSPQLDKLVKAVDTLVGSQQTQGGQAKGISMTTGAIVTAISLIGGLFYIAAQVTKPPPAPQIVYVPTPALPAK